MAQPTLRANGVDAELALFECLDEFHQQITQRLAVLKQLVDALGPEGASAEQRAQALDLANWFGVEARQHHLDEERHIFPALLTSADPELAQHTLRLIQDHGWIEADWVEVSPVLRAIAEGQGWVNVESLRASVEVLCQLYLDHIALEESLAYPEARARMEPARAAALLRDIERRRQQRESREEVQA